MIDRLVTGMVNAADDGDALNVGAAAAVKQAVDVPVIAVGRIHDPERAEQILADGRADFIAMGRPMLADPELPLKVEAGLTGRIRRCISCENCIDAMEQRFSVDCAVNPRTGKERELAVHRTPSRKKVVVIGSGPAGMEAARVAAERGHHVTLFERDTQTGGALLWASILHPENEPFLRYLRDEVGRSHGEDRTGSRAFGRRRGGHAARRGGGGQWRPGGAAYHPRFRPAACADGRAMTVGGWPALRSGRWRKRCRLAIASSSSVPTWWHLSLPNSSPPVAGWCRCWNPERRSRQSWATNARPNTWTDSTD